MTDTFATPDIALERRAKIDAVGPVVTEVEVIQ